jgi:hypothetical protein
MKYSHSLGLICFLFLCSSVFINKKKIQFAFKENEQGVKLYEDEMPVYFYQKEPKALQGQYICNNYLHPLFSLEGDTLTEESPDDHPYHRGIYWAWHQIYINNKSVANGWVMQDISQEVSRLRTSVTKTTAQLDAEVFWKSSAWQNGKPFVYEHTTITVYRQKQGGRIIDFEIRLKALVPDVSIGGSDDEKGYGGFCARIKMPEDLVFTSAKGPVVPQTLQVEAGPWMDFSGSFGTKSRKSGLTIICNPLTPNYPAPWILRRTGSMQNVVYPGRQRIVLPMDKALVLKYRLVIHEGDANDVNMDQFILK